MYQFDYDHLKPKYGSDCTLLFTDTDSFSCHINTNNIYDGMAENLNHFDTSNFERDHPLYTRQSTIAFWANLGAKPGLSHRANLWA